VAVKNATRTIRSLGTSWARWEHQARPFNKETACESAAAAACLAIGEDHDVQISVRGGGRADSPSAVTADHSIAAPAAWLKISKSHPRAIPTSVIPAACAVRIASAVGAARRSSRRATILVGG